MFKCMRWSNLNFSPYLNMHKYSLLKPFLVDGNIQYHMTLIVFMVSIQSKFWLENFLKKRAEGAMLKISRDAEASVVIMATTVVQPSLYHHHQTFRRARLIFSIAPSLQR